MKRSFLLIAVICSLQLQAQHLPGKIALYFGGGYLSAPYLQKEVFHSLHSKSNSGKHNCIILTAGAMKDIHPKWTAGFTITFDHFGLEDRSIEYYNTNFMLLIQRKWVESGHLVLYSGLSGGIHSGQKLEKDIVVQKGLQPAWHICLAGFGLQADRFMLDLGIGYGVNGILSLGARYRF